MGARKHIAAEKIKEARKNLYFAKLKGVPSSPRKMRYVVDMIRGLEVSRKLPQTLRNYSVLQLLTGRPKMTVRLKMENYISAKYLLMKVLQ